MDFVWYLKPINKQLVNKAERRSYVECEEWVWSWAGERSMRRSLAGWKKQEIVTAVVNKPIHSSFELTRWETTPRNCSFPAWVVNKWSRVPGGIRESFNVPLWPGPPCLEPASSLSRPVPEWDPNERQNHESRSIGKVRPFSISQINCVNIYDFYPHQVLFPQVAIICCMEKWASDFTTWSFCREASLMVSHLLRIYVVSILPGVLTKDKVDHLTWHSVFPDESLIGSVRLLWRWIYRLTFLGAWWSGGTRPKYADNTVLVYTNCKKRSVLEFTFSQLRTGVRCRRERLWPSLPTRSCISFPQQTPEAPHRFHQANPLGLCDSPSWESPTLWSSLDSKK